MNSTNVTETNLENSIETLITETETGVNLPSELTATGMVTGQVTEVTEKPEPTFEEMLELEVLDLMGRRPGAKHKAILDVKEKEYEATYGRKFRLMGWRIVPGSARQNLNQATWDKFKNKITVCLHNVDTDELIKRASSDLWTFKGGPDAVKAARKANKAAKKLAMARDLAGDMDDEIDGDDAE